MFPDVDHVRDMQKELDEIIQLGVFNITRLLRNAEQGVAREITVEEEDDHVAAAKSRQAQRAKVGD